jgi:hypothetical protein
MRFKTYCSPTVLAALMILLAAPTRHFCPRESLLSFYPSCTMPATVAGHPPIVLLLFEAFNEDRITGRIPHCTRSLSARSSVLLVFAVFSHYVEEVI